MPDMSNIVAIKGVMQQITKESRLCGLGYEHYRTTTQTRRNSGTIDRQNIIIPAALEKEVAEVMATMGDKQEQPVICTGRLQALKDWDTGRVFVFVLADFIGVIAAETWETENEVHIEAATLGKSPIYRKTPKGKHIADVTLKVPCAIRENIYSYIPAVFWESDAIEVQEKTEGSAVTVDGRLQSRDYTKKMSDGTAELRVAYELSVRKVEYREV